MEKIPRSYFSQLDRFLQKFREAIFEIQINVICLMVNLEYANFFVKNSALQHQHGNMEKLEN